MSEQCDNKSVGVILYDSEQGLLLINRAKPPYGWAAPAGHVDDHGDSTTTAIEEVYEETGLIIAASSLSLAIQNRRIAGECCRGGVYHDWDVYIASAPHGEINTNPDEVQGIMFADQATLHALHTQAILSNPQNPGLEPVWQTFLSELGYLS
jgi:8-oxo-dGTP pyrophosphatase MutT (NUDIX family)